MIKRSPVPQAFPTVPRAQVPPNRSPFPTPYRGTGTGTPQRKHRNREAFPSETQQSPPSRQYKRGSVLASVKT